MNSREKKMVGILTDLKEKHHVIGIKTEFEVEGARLDDTLRLKEITMKSGLGITLKIGGCEAITDMRAARAIGVSKLVAPMIETSFAMKKFVNAVKTVFPQDELDDIGIIANIETIDGYRNFDKMMELTQYGVLSGIVIGRKDLAFSMGLALTDLDSDKIFNICSSLFKKVKVKYPEQKCIIGGIADAGSLAVLNTFEDGLLNAYETRKVIFSVPGGLENGALEGLKKAIDFELLWYANKSDYYGRVAQEDENYVKRIKKMAETLREA